MSQVVQRRNFRYHYGDTWDGADVLWKDADGLPINLSGYAAQLAIKAKVGAGAGEATVLKLTNGASDGLVIDTALGKVTINATPTKMTSGTLAQGQGYFYDLQVKNGSETQTLLEGEFWVDGEVTTD